MTGTQSIGNTHGFTIGDSVGQTRSQSESFGQSHGISQSMSRAGCPYDNAPMERDYNTLKTELIYQHNFETAAEPDYAVSEFAYDWYNQIRPHSYNGYLTPFEKRSECSIKQ